MKRIIAPFFVMIFLSSAVQAQLTDNFRFGFNLSPAITWLTSDAPEGQVDSNGSNLAFKMGMMGDYYLGSEERFAITSGINITFNQGGALKYNNLGASGNLFPDSELSSSSLDSLANGTSVRYKLQYLEIPVALKMRTADIAAGGYMRFFAEVPLFTLGFNTKATADIDAPGGEGQKVNDDINLFNVFWGLGGGVEYTVGQNTTLIGGIFYQNGMFDVTQDNNADDNKASLHSLTLRLGVMF